MTMTMTPTEAPVTVEDEGTTDKRKLALIGGVVAVALAAGGWFLLGGSGGSSGPALGLPAGGLAKPAAVKPAVKAAKKVSKPVSLIPAASTAKLGRDPFHALYVVPVAAPAGAAPAGSTTTGTAPAGSTTGTTGSTSGTGTTLTAPYSLTLLGVTGSDAKIYAFNVGSTKKSVVAAQKFGKYGELVVLAYLKNSKGAVTGALLQVGDADPITIALGEKLTVQ